MKILRVLRRRKIRLSFIFILLLIFIVNSYAWILYNTDASTGALVANVSAWAVEFVIEDEDIKVEEYTYEIEEFHPGIEPIEKKISIYNVGDANSHLKYRITEIYLYGKQILKKELTQDYLVNETLKDQEELIPETIGKEKETEDGYITVNAFEDETATIFDNSNTYGYTLRYPTPFTISYTYDKNYIEGKDGSETSIAGMTLNLEWENDDEQNNEEDTKLGTLAYDFKQTNPDEPALKIIVEVTALRDKV